jgi:hypothetical protein
MSDKTKNNQVVNKENKPETTKPVEQNNTGTGIFRLGLFRS